MPFQRRAQAANFIVGQEPFAAAPPVSTDSPARVAAFGAVSENFGFPYDHRQDRYRPVGGRGRKPEGGEPLPDIPARDGTGRLSPEPGQDLVFRFPAIDRERTWFPVAAVAMEHFICDVLERGPGEFGYPGSGSFTPTFLA